MNVVPFPAPVASRVDDAADQALAAAGAVQELRDLMAVPIEAAETDFVRFSCRLLIDEAISHLAACRLQLA